jgi:hypothetical protein
VPEVKHQYRRHRFCSGILHEQIGLHPFLDVSDEGFARHKSHSEGLAVGDPPI